MSDNGCWIPISIIYYWLPILGEQLLNLLLISIFFAFWVYSVNLLIYEAQLKWAKYHRLFGLLQIKLSEALNTNFPHFGQIFKALENF